MVKGEIPYDQAAIDTAIAQLEESVGKIADAVQAKSEARCGRREVWSVAESLEKQG